MGSIVGLIILLLLGGGFAGLIVLQVKLSRKEAAMPGLILPIVSFLLALLCSILPALFMYNTTAFVSETQSIGYYDDEGNFVVESESVDYYENMEEYEAYEESATIGIAIIPVLGMSIVPCIVFLIIYFACHPSRKKRAKQSELTKMSINDL